MSQPDDLVVANTMMQRGGSFVTHLGELYHYADEDNRRRLRGAFPELWARYREMARAAAHEVTP